LISPGELSLAFVWKFQHNPHTIEKRNAILSTAVFCIFIVEVNLYEPSCNSS
jgi:hypothetical protein